MIFIFLKHDITVRGMRATAQENDQKQNTQKTSNLLMFIKIKILILRK